MMEFAQPSTQEGKPQQARRIAADCFRRDPDWNAFHREILGVGGIVDQLFPGVEARAEFEKSSEYTEIQKMLAKLRERNRPQKQGGQEPTRVITVRLPQSLHEALRHEAHSHHTSMNKLCISKLLQVVSDELVPSDFERREPELPQRTATLEPPAPTQYRPSQPAPEPTPTRPTLPPYGTSSTPSGRPF